MATLLLTAVGTALGGPVGGALGALAGRQIDAAITSSSSREGPRLKDLQISTSSYGHAIPWHFGAMRVPGSIIWATDLKEQSETSGGGKGTPKTTAYSYSISFAVALASRPIDGLGRIWADGNLLRGAAGDLKTGGSLRLYTGWADQQTDPLISAIEGPQSPAYRNIAYVVFEDLPLADFGNRIPALTFEVFAGDGADTLVDMLAPFPHLVRSPTLLPAISGFTWGAGTLGQNLAAIDTIYPLFANTDAGELVISGTAEEGGLIKELPEPVIGGDESEFGEQTGHIRRREVGRRIGPGAIRYYDPARDYQPGTQRATGRPALGPQHQIEFPGALSAAEARKLIEDAALRSLQTRETLAWRLAELDPDLSPGAIVRAPGIDGTWRVAEWEWRENGIELSLQRHTASLSIAVFADEGRAWTPPDLIQTPTLLRAFELPQSAVGGANSPIVYAAAASQSEGWPGAALYSDRYDTLEPLDTFVRTQAITGTLLTHLLPSSAIRFEPKAEATISLIGEHASVVSTDCSGLARGDNRLLIGGEIVQFAEAERISHSDWRLVGLLRGRAATERAASIGHEQGVSVTLLSERLMPLTHASLSGADRIAAIGHADNVPVYAPIENRGLTLRPLAPVHPRLSERPDGSLRLCWTRRARGAWVWEEEVDVPLGEDREAYLVGIGQPARPHTSWETTTNSLSIAPTQRADLALTFPGEPLWVRQMGTHALSEPTLLGILQ